MLQIAKLPAATNCSMRRHAETSLYAHSYA
jgi:hypothetical protein